MASQASYGERRAQRRYQIAFELDYRIVRAGVAVSSGMGRTVNMSSHGLLFQTEAPLAKGDHLQLTIRWPSGHESRLQLQGYGRVLRSDASGTAVLLTRHQFEKLTAAAMIFGQAGDHVVVQ